MPTSTTTSLAIAALAAQAWMTNSLSTPNASEAAMQQLTSATDFCETAAAPAMPATQQWDADRYQSHHSFVYEYGSSLLDLLQDATEGSILDVGCGTGELTHALLQKARAGHTVVGIDADASMIARARQQYPDMTFHVQDVRTLQVQEPFDVVFSNAALHWVGPDYAQQAVQHLAAALKVGGKLIVEFGGKGNVESITQALRIVAPDETPDIWYFPSIGEFTSLLEHHGIEVLQASLFDRPTVLLQGIDSSSGIQNWLRMFANKYFEGLSEEETISILKKVEAKLRPKLYDGQQWIADYRRIRVVGRKV